MDIFIIIMMIGIIFIFHTLDKIYKLYQEEVAQKNKPIEQKPTPLREVKINQFESFQRDIKSEDFYRQNAIKPKYLLFNLWKEGLENVALLYSDVIIDNLWLNEPFHTKFYEFLILINDNDFMIIDSNSKVITMNLRDENNKIQTSKSYQVFSSREIIKFVIKNCMYKIKNLNTNEAQNLILAIFVLVLKQSVHYQAKEEPQNVIDELLEGYNYTEEINQILNLINAKKESVYFIQEFIDQAFLKVETLPYNDTEIPKTIQIERKIPKKYLQTI